jgi:hypothetical protein
VTLGDWLWSLFVIFFMVIYFMMLFRIIFDVFRSEDLGGWGKAGWLIALLFFPIISMLVYVIVRGKSMVDRDVQGMQAAQQETDAYIRSVASASPDPASQIAKAQELLKAGAIDQDEFSALKARALAA